MDAELDKVDEMSAETQASATNLFEKADFLNGANLSRKVLIPELGGYVTYKKLTWMESRELNKFTDTQERSIKTLAVMFGKANPHLNIEEILRSVSLEDLGTISKRIFANDQSPLPPTKPTK